MEKLLKKIKKEHIIFLTILILGFFVRFYQLGEVPSSMNRDEPAIGYNAYSILKTGKDEWGIKFPLMFKSFGDYKSPLYIYATVLPVIFFGLNEWSVRFWAALAGFLFILINYLLMKKIILIKNISFSLMLAFITAIGSWQIFYSRFSFEANLALFLNAWILYLLVKNNFEKPTKGIVLLMILSMLSYSSSLIIWPIFVLISTIFYLLKKKIKLSIKEFTRLLIYVVVILVIFFSQISISGQKKRITIFDNPQIRLNYNDLRTKIAKNNLWEAKLFYNQYFYYGKIFVKNYINSFSLNFLFSGGGQHPWHKIPKVPHFYPIYSLLIFLGFIFFIKTKVISKINKFYLSLFFFLTPIASAITIDSPHATRLLNLFFIFSILSVFGLCWLFQNRKKIGIFIVVIIILNFLQFCKFYFIDYKENPPAEILPGLKKVINVLEKEKFTTDRIVFDNNSDGAYSYLLFYSLYPPNDFISKVKRYSPDTAGFEWVEKLDKYLFVNDPIPDLSYKEIYILKNDNNLGQKIIYNVKNQANDRNYYTITKNY